VIIVQSRSGRPLAMFVVETDGRQVYIRTDVWIARTLTDADPILIGADDDRGLREAIERCAAHLADHIREETGA